MNINSTDNIVSSFENKLLISLNDCGVKMGKCSIGVAVSGGADSISLLYGLSHLFSLTASKSPRLEVITVNHFIRPEEETTGDVRFVIDCCNKLSKDGYNVNCTVVELKPGEVEKLAKKRKAGIEDSARFLRYKAFEQFIANKNLDYLCLAHNKNDQLETVLMRFLQGSSVDSAGGISFVREKYIRPMLNITRAEIENYLIAQNLSWCEDKTNKDTSYFRNNIRHNLVPFLNEHFSGWDKAVLAGAVKAGEDADIINDVVLASAGDVELGNDGKITKISFNKNDFCKEKSGVQKRLLIKAFNQIGETKRIPNAFLNDFIKSLLSYNNVKSINSDFSKVYDGIEISVKKSFIFVKKCDKKVTDSVFFDIIEDSGVFDFPFGKVSVTFNNNNVYFTINGCESIVKAYGPIIIRSFLQGDTIKGCSGQQKKVADIFSDWHVIESHKNMIPVIYCAEKGPENIIAVLGSFLGYKDWIVK